MNKKRQLSHKVRLLKMKTKTKRCFPLFRKGILNMVSDYIVCFYCGRLLLGSSREEEKEKDTHREEREKENGAETKSRPSTRRLSGANRGPGEIFKKQRKPDPGSQLSSLRRKYVRKAEGLKISEN